MKKFLILILLIFIVNTLKLKKKLKVKQENKEPDEVTVPNIVVQEIKTDNKNLNEDVSLF